MCHVAGGHTHFILCRTMAHARVDRKLTISRRQMTEMTVARMHGPTTGGARASSSPAEPAFQKPLDVLWSRVKELANNTIREENVGWRGGTRGGISQRVCTRRDLQLVSMIFSSIPNFSWVAFAVILRWIILQRSIWMIHRLRIVYLCHPFCRCNDDNECVIDSSWKGTSRGLHCKLQFWPKVL